MKPSELLSYVVAGLIIFFILTLLITQLMGQPFIIFVETGSMSPTLQPNDGYIAVPAFLAGDIEEGDVILFQAQELGGGELTTHRVVRETSQGYITKGDANPFVDQDGDEPPVQQGQIKSVGLKMNGELVVIPGLGATVTSITLVVAGVQAQVFGFFGLESPGVTALSMAILVIGLVFFIYSFTRGGGGKDARNRTEGSLLRNGLVIMAILTIVVLIPVNFSMLLPSGVYQIEMVSTLDPTEEQQVLGVGESGEVTYFMQNSGHIPVLVFLEPAGAGVQTPTEPTYVPRRTTINRSVTMTAPNETGRFLRFVQEYRYLVLLPPSMIEALYRIHPVLPMVLINIEVAAVVMLFSLYTLGTGRVRIRSTSRDITIEQRIKRRLPFVSLSPRQPPARSVAQRDPIYNWVNRQERLSAESSPWTRSARARALDESSVGRAEPEPGPARRDARPGTDGSNRLSGRQLIEMYETLQRPPAAAGVDARRWTPDVLQNYLREEYDIRYSLPNCVRLLARTGHEPAGTNT